MPGPKPGTGTLLDEELARELAKRVEFGLSFRRAALSLGLSEHTAYKWMRRARLGQPPYAELMYAVLDAQERWKNGPPEIDSEPENPAPLEIQARDSRLAFHDHEKARKSRGLVPV
jgi:transposase-like protein